MYQSFQGFKKPWAEPNPSLSCCDELLEAPLESCWSSLRGSPRLRAFGGTFRPKPCASKMSLPKSSNVIPFVVFRSIKKKIGQNQKGTTLEPVGKKHGPAQKIR